MRLAVIPARGGSKRIPRKNVKLFAGRPILAWSIDAAKRSDCFDRIVVSTDDEAIAAVARAYGVEVPFIRPAELADDYTGTIPVIQHTIRQFQSQGLSPDEVCCIYATAPFIQPDDLTRGLAILREQRCDYAFSVTSYPFPIQRALRLTVAGRVQMFHPEHFNTRSQDLEEAWHDAGQFYWGTAGAWLSGRALFTPDAATVILPRNRVQDIDTLEDWSRAEWMFKAMRAASTPS